VISGGAAAEGLGNFWFFVGLGSKKLSKERYFLANWAGIL